VGSTYALRIQYVAAIASKAAAVMAMRIMALSPATLARNNLAMREAAQKSANRNIVAQTAMTATNAESNARSFRSSIRERSHQPSYEWMLAMAVLLSVGVFGIAFA
jgi:hypothetical protein